jgi:hypothetical protein
MIEPRGAQEFSRQPLSELAKARFLESNYEQWLQEAAEGLQIELSSGFEGDSIDFDPRAEVLKFLDRKNDCIIHVFPLN